MQQEATQVATSSHGALAPFAPLPPQAAIGGAGGLSREVFGFALASSLADPTFGYPSWNFSLLSTVAFFGLHVQDDGNFAPDSGWNVWNSSQTSELMNAARPYGTKVVLTIVMQDFAPNTPHMCAALQHYATTAASTVAQVKAKGVAGVNVDFEGLNSSCGGPDSSWTRHAFRNFVALLRSQLPAGSYLSVDTYASSAADPLGFYDVPGMSPSVDSFFVMAYDLEYSNYSRAPTSCSSFCLGPTAPLTGYYYNDTSTMQQYVSVVPASQVILGVPYYGRKACVGSVAPNQYPAGSVVADTYLDASTESTIPGPGFQPGSFVAHRDANDPGGQERWDTWFNTTLNCTRELYWDDTVSLGRKYDLVNADGLRGVGIWNLNYGGGAPELWSALASHFSAASRPFKGLYTVDAYGGISPDDSPWLTTSAYWPGWKIARTGKPLPGANSPQSGLVMDAWGGLHPYGAPAITESSPGHYWPGWDIARDFAFLPDGTGGFVLDGWGGLHPFRVNGSTTPLQAQGNPYWGGWDIARKVVIFPDGTGGYTMDAWGGLHPFGINGPAPVSAVAQSGAYWPGWNIARDVVLVPGNGNHSGYILDGWGGLHPFHAANDSSTMPAAIAVSAYWGGWDIARGVFFLPGSATAGYTLDGYGGPHPFGGAPAITSYPYWGGSDIARAIIGA